MKCIQMNFRLSHKEADRIRKLAYSSGLTVSEYVRRSALKERITEIHSDKREIRDCHVELSRQGNNLNQMARVLNTYGAAPDSVGRINNLLSKMEVVMDTLFEIAHKSVVKKE